MRVSGVGVVSNIFAIFAKMLGLDGGVLGKGKNLQFLQVFPLHYNELKPKF